MSPDQHLIRVRSRIEGRLKASLPERGAAPAAVLKAMRYSVFSRGKRIRPLIAVESCRACGGTVSQALGAACAIELVHTYSLIHDDLPAMDDDDMRRGKPASHKAFGEAIAILAGDALLTRAFEIIARDLPPGPSREVAAEVAGASGAEGMVGGQALDLGYGVKGDRAERVRRINLCKTARLFEASAKTGAICARAGAKETAALARFGRYFGLSFQIVDDIIDGGGYVKVFGAARSKNDAADFAAKALKALAIFGKKAATLAAITGRILKRTR